MSLFSMYPYSPSPTVYIVSDSELKRLREKNTRNEIAELQKVIDSHQLSIERLKKTIESLESDLSEVESSKAA